MKKTIDFTPAPISKKYLMFLRFFKKHIFSKSALGFVLYFIIFCLVFYYIFNFNALFSQFKYRYLKESFQRDAQKVIQAQGAEMRDSLMISKIDISAPIIFLEEENEKQIKEALKEGVVLYPKSNFIERNGEVIITGHSSGGSTFGKYNSVFSLLDKLQGGDKIQINFSGEKRFYEVQKRKVFWPKEAEKILKGTKNHEILLVTCYPIGTTLKRLVVFAK